MADLQGPDLLPLRVKEAIGDESARNFALRAGIKPSTLRSIMSGTRPVIDNLVAIADTAGVSLEWLATGRGDRRPPTFEGAPKDEIDELLEGSRLILARFEDLPMAGDIIGVGHPLWTIYTTLHDIARDESNSDTQRGEADLLLRVAFDDRGAERRHARRVKEAGARMRAAYDAVDAALVAVEWAPSQILKEELRTITFRHDLPVDDLVLLLVAIRDEVIAAKEAHELRAADKE